jgi:Zn-finger nucleic acid-binding protein
MAESFQSHTLEMDMELPCPRCGYPVWVIMGEIVAQCTVLCPCCRIRIRLQDADGSVQLLDEEIEQKVRALFEGLGR